MTRTRLLDANVLIALTFTDHEHHSQAVEWAHNVAAIALCPIVEGALTRFLVRMGDSYVTAVAVLTAMYASPRCEFWADSVSLAQVELAHVIGHGQVTDAYLAGLAASRGGVLATFDRALAEALPASTELVS